MLQSHKFNSFSNDVLPKYILVEVENSKETRGEGKFRETTEGFKVRSEPAIGDIADIPDREYSDTQPCGGDEDIREDASGGRIGHGHKLTWTEHKPARKKRLADIADIPEREYSDTGDTQSSDRHGDILCDDASGRRIRPKSTWIELKPARKKKFALTRFKKKSDNDQDINVTGNKANRNTRANERKISEKSVEKAQIKEIDYEIIGSSTNVTKIVGPDGKNTTTIEKTMTKNDVEDMRMNKVTDEENENIDFNIKDLKSHMESILKDFHKNDYEDTGNITQNKKYIKYGPNGDKVTTIKKTIVHNDEDYDEEEYKEV